MDPSTEAPADPPSGEPGAAPAAAPEAGPSTPRKHVSFIVGIVAGGLVLVAIGFAAG